MNVDSEFFLIGADNRPHRPPRIASRLGACYATPVRHVWYFAYGSNMQSATLRGRRGVAYRRAVPARVSGWELVFDKPGLLGTGEAYASLVPVRRATAYGVLFEITPDDMAHIDLTEGVLIGSYRRVAVTATALQTRTRRTAFTLTSDRRSPGARPTSRYMDVVIAGAVEHGLPDHHVDLLRGVPTQPESHTATLLRPLVDQFLKKR